jgi:hypothetical protein
MPRRSSRGKAFTVLKVLAARGFPEGQADRVAPEGPAAAVLVAQMAPVGDRVDPAAPEDQEVLAEDPAVQVDQEVPAGTGDPAVSPGRL